MLTYKPVQYVFPYVAGVDVRGQGADCHVFPCRSRVPQDVSVLLAGWRGAHHQPQHTAHCRGLDG